MDSPDISELNPLGDDSRLLSESSLLASNTSSSTQDHADNNDLSLSDLSLVDRPVAGQSRRPKFSLLAQPRRQEPSYAGESAIAEEDAEYDLEDGLDQTMTQEDVEKAKKLAARTREEKLQHDLFILRKLNTAFELYKDALKEAQSGSERLAARLEHTNALLDKYVNVLSNEEKVAKLIMDERWQGADADEKLLKRERQEAEERSRREEEERALAAQRERDRLEHEKQERKEREERERLERERAESARAAGRGSGVRGVRGTRASMRGARAAASRVVSDANARGTRGIPIAPTRRTTTSAPTRASVINRGITR